jgi:selenide,water dikinase
MRHVPPTADPSVIVGLESGDDAAVYRTPSGDAIVATTDFFTPVVDDAFDFGRVAAANSLSDVYAMGGRPLFALSVVAFPVKIGIAVLGRIMDGAAAVAAEAGIPILGGHSVDDPVPKFGLVAIGVVDPKRMTTNRGARAGDVLYLTKPLGSGAMTGAIKKDALAPGEIREVTAVMAALNRGASEAMVEAGAHAATDVTGYGLLGHLQKMMAGSAMAARVRVKDLPLIPGARRFYDAGQVPGGTRRNLEYFGAHAKFAPGLADADRLLVADAQTNGGLLIAISAANAQDFERAAARRGVTPHEIGEVVAGDPGTVEFS